MLRWHGGKWRLAPQILPLLPPHRIYVEPYGGAASILLRKPRAYAEVYNDLDDLVVNLFRVLRDTESAARLVRALMLTPFARSEFEDAADPEADCPVEMARRLVVRAFMGFGANPHASVEREGGRYPSTGFRAASNRSGTTPAHDWRSYPAALVEIVERLRGVVVEHRDGATVMAAHDSAATLHYVDPPYMAETRGRGNPHDPKHRYRHELTDDDHAEMLTFLRGLKGMVVLSGYPHDLYEEMLAGWDRRELSAYADGARPRTEVVWRSPAAMAAWRTDPAAVPLFGGGPAHA